MLYTWICCLEEVVFALGSLPACAKGSPVLGPDSGESPVPELVYLGLLVALVCGLLVVLARLAFRRTGRRGLSPFSGSSALWIRIADFGRLGFGCRNPVDLRAGQDGSSTLQGWESLVTGCLVC